MGRCQRPRSRRSRRCGLREDRRMIRPCSEIHRSSIGHDIRKWSEGAGCPHICVFHKMSFQNPHFCRAFDAPADVQRPVVRVANERLDELQSTRPEQGMVGANAVDTESLCHEPALTAGLFAITGERDLRFAGRLTCERQWRVDQTKSIGMKKKQKHERARRLLH